MSPLTPNWTTKSTKVETGVTIVDPKMTTITSSNTTGWTPVSTTTTDPILKNMEYAIQTDGKVTYRYNNLFVYESFQDMVDFGPGQIYTWNNQTSLRITDSMQNNLLQRSSQSGVSSPTAPIPPQQPLSGSPPLAPELPGPSGPEITALASKQLSIAPGSGLRYPKLMTDEQDKIKFQAVKIKPRDQSTSTGLDFQFAKPSYEIAQGPNGEPEGSVVLAIQSPISDQNSVDWGPDTLNAIDSAILGAASKLVNTNTNQISDVLQQELNIIYNEAKKYGDRMRKFLIGQAAGINNILARTDNVVLNPNLELLFQGPQLRPFSFQFKMSARSQPEADEIKSIIKYFKYHMAVRKEQGLFLRAPHVFTIQYLKGETTHPGINLISPNPTTKACALTNCSVDYTPLGSYMTYEDGTMASYTLSLQFQEITPIYDSDYVDNPHPIGY